MKCNSIKYENFRNIVNSTLEFSTETNIFIGENAQGKTSFLEGIYLFARGKSFRGSHDREMIKFGSDYTALTMDCTGRDRRYEMKYAVNTQGKRICRRNGVEQRRLSEFVGYFRAVLFCPSHLSIVQSGPAARRGFLDFAISQNKPAYVEYLQRYNAILIRRNALIRNACRSGSTSSAVFKDTLDALSTQLSEMAEKISAARSKYVVLLGKYTSAFMRDMTNGKETPELTYLFPKTKEEYYKELTENLDRELKYGATLYGIHKDDIDIKINGLCARTYASQGQQRSCALSMKLAEGELCAEILRGEQPVYLFDDVLSELDISRRDYVTSGFSGKQVFITSCTGAGLENISASNAAKLKITNGEWKKIK